MKFFIVLFLATIILSSFFQLSSYHKPSENISKSISEINRKFLKVETNSFIILDSLTVYKSHNELNKLFNGQVIKEYNEGDGFRSPVSILFGDDSTKKVYFHWKNDDFTGLAGVQIKIDYSMENPPKKSAWKCANGLTLGTPLEQLVKYNNKPITFYGFEWDNAGLVIDYNGGKLTSRNIGIELGYTNDDENILGEIKLNSSMAAVKNAKCFIQSITIW